MAQQRRDGLLARTAHVRRALRGDPGVQHQPHRRHPVLPESRAPHAGATRRRKINPPARHPVVPRVQFRIQRVGAVQQSTCRWREASLSNSHHLLRGARRGGRGRGKNHQLSPGMVLTDPPRGQPGGKTVFNVLAEEPEAMAADVVPKCARRRAPTPRSVLTLPDAVRRVVFGVPQILGGGRFFDGRGNRVVEDGARYKPNGVRLLYDEMQ